MGERKTKFIVGDKVWAITNSNTKCSKCGCYTKNSKWRIRGNYVLAETDSCYYDFMSRELDKDGWPLLRKANIFKTARLAQAECARRDKER